MKSYSSESHFRSFRLLFASLKTLSSRRKHSHKVRRCCFHSTPFPSALDSRLRASFLVKESARSKQPRVLLRLNLVSVPSTTPRGTRRRFISFSNKNGARSTVNALNATKARGRGSSTHGVSVLGNGVKCCSSKSSSSTSDDGDDEEKEEKEEKADKGSAGNANDAKPNVPLSSPQRMNNGNENPQPPRSVMLVNRATKIVGTYALVSFLAYAYEAAFGSFAGNPSATNAMKERRARVLQVSYSKFLRDARKNEIGTVTVAGDRLTWKPRKPTVIETGGGSSEGKQQRRGGGEKTTTLSKNDGSKSFEIHYATRKPADAQTPYAQLEKNDVELFSVDADGDKNAFDFPF